MASGIMGVTGHIFGITETNFAGGNGGTAASPVVIDGTPTHIPFNEFKSEPSITVPQRELETSSTQGSHFESPYNGMIESTEFSTEHVYHAPFMMRQIFSSATIGSWADDANATLKFEALLANHEAADNSLAMNVHGYNASGSNHMDYDLYGAAMTSYEWNISRGDNLVENLGWKFANCAANSVSMKSAPTFYKQGIAHWNQQLIDQNHTQNIAVPSTAFTFNAFTALDNSVKWTDISFKIECDREMSGHTNMLTPDMAPRKAYKVTVTLEGTALDTTPWDEALLPIQSRSDATCVLQWTRNTSFWEKLSCTHMVISNASELVIPEPGGDALAGVSVELIATRYSVLEFDGKYDFQTLTTPDPSAYIPT